MNFEYKQPINLEDKATPAQKLGITVDTPVWVAVPETNSHEFYVGEELRLVEDDGTSELFFRSVKRPHETWYVLLDEITLVEPTPAFFGWDVGDWGEDLEGTLVQLVNSSKPEFLKFKDGQLYSPLRVELDFLQLKRFPKLPRVFQILVDSSTHSELLKHKHLEHVRGVWMSGHQFTQFQPCVIGNYFLCFDGDIWHWEHVSNVNEGSVTIMPSQFTQWLTHRHRSVTKDKVECETPEQAPAVPKTPLQLAGLEVGAVCILREDYRLGTIGEGRTLGGDPLVLKKHSAVVVTQDDGTNRPRCKTLQTYESGVGGRWVFPYVDLLQDTGLKLDASER